jgi:hypothetical protein
MILISKSSLFSKYLIGIDAIAVGYPAIVSTVQVLARRPAATTAQRPIVSLARLPPHGFSRIRIARSNILCFRKLDPYVLVVQPSQSGICRNAAKALDSSLLAKDSQDDAGNKETNDHQAYCRNREHCRRSGSRGWRIGGYALCGQERFPTALFAFSFGFAPNSFFGIRQIGKLGLQLLDIRACLQIGIGLREREKLSQRVGQAATGVQVMRERARIVAARELDQRRNPAVDAWMSVEQFAEAFARIVNAHLHHCRRRTRQLAVPVPTANLKRLTVASESVDSRGNAACQAQERGDQGERRGRRRRARVIHRVASRPRIDREVVTYHITNNNNPLAQS